MLPHNLAIGDAHAEQVAVARVGPAGRCRPKVSKAVTNRNGRKRLLSTIGTSRQLIGYPNRRQGINRQRLQTTARKRHEYHAAGVYHTRGRIDLCRQRRFGNSLTRIDILLKQLGANGHVEVVTDQQRVGNTLAPFARALELAHPFCLGVLRGHRSIGYLVGARITRPIAVPVGTCGARVQNYAVKRFFTIGRVDILDVVAGLEHSLVGTNLGIFAIDVELPIATRRLIRTQLPTVGRRNALQEEVAVLLRRLQLVPKARSLQRHRRQVGSRRTVLELHVVEGVPDRSLLVSIRTNQTQRGLDFSLPNLVKACAEGGVIQHDAIAGGEVNLAGADLRCLPVNKKLPVLARRRIPAQLATIRRSDITQIVTRRAHTGRGMGHAL